MPVSLTKNIPLLVLLIVSLKIFKIIKGIGNESNNIFLFSHSINARTYFVSLTSEQLRKKIKILSVEPI